MQLNSIWLPDCSILHRSSSLRVFINFILNLQHQHTVLLLVFKGTMEELISGTYSENSRDAVFYGAAFYF